MTAASRPSEHAAEGLSRRSFLTRSAADGAGVLLSGGVTGLFGTASAIPGAPKGRCGLRPAGQGPNGLFYRWTPPAEALPLGKGVLEGLAADAGTLEALRATSLKGAFVPDLSVARKPGTTFRATWVAVPDRGAAGESIRNQFDEITRSRKLEGMWWSDGGAWFVGRPTPARRTAAPPSTTGRSGSSTPRATRSS